MLLDKTDYEWAMKAANHSKCTDDENAFLNEMALRYIALDSVSKTEYLKLQSLTGGSLTLEPSIFER